MANKERVKQHLETMSQYTATPNEGMTRYSYSPEDVKTRKYIKEKMAEYGLTVREDGLGNIFGKLEGKKEFAPSVLIGSHFDSVPHGGNYDGPAGVIAGLEVAALFQEHNIKPTYPLEVIAMIEEEGSRFGGGLMGSRGINGLIGEEDFHTIRDKDGISVIEAMQEAGLDPTLPKHRDPKTMKAFLELHIEQGPILEEENISIGVVDTIVGLTQFEVTIEGKAGHAGTTPMDRRSDALITAATIVSQLPKLAKAEGNGTVITTGQFAVYPNGSNVIPDKVIFSIDLRSGEEASIQRVMEKVKALIESYQKDGIKTSIEQQLYIQPKELSKEVRSSLKESTGKLGISSIPMLSGAGHDAMVFSDYTEAGMIFIPSKDGLSHCPEEWSDLEHLAQGVDVLFETAKRLTEAE
ncbi:Zn-dependent hydrolase [Bacilli bacterium]|uniref:Zn-dependent hydrolase n=2 Tax=Bacillaceae TaxID=186817 RepID=UPI000622124D|nr:Zn-dependent hydrolase [Oceanobacillus caeni]KKE77916.1 allantoate amidohydrolase [Bacilli bacterium VT-13-104]PZD82995.1 Zn-dependent hydrolase [Bacilli bacterium]MBU8792344.1 Zn-dependent hydrolase [Oceanobacillus caeni]MED4475849.1 Zn-dependent hydrolase [Oceanobacillus caeni]PZD83990.1 Zn-dependent hydrolase [Bacilli bacterium]